MRYGKSIALAFCLALLAAFVLGEALFGGETVVGLDQLNYAYPRLNTIGAALARGEVARWNPFMYHGSSMLGPRAGGVAYPPYLLYAFLPLVLAKGVFVALHLGLAVEGMRRFARFDSGPTASLVTGLLYGFGGWVVSMYWGPFLISSALLPWACLGGAMIPKDPYRGVFCGGSALALILVASEPQGALIAAAGLGLTAVARSGDAKARSRSAVYGLIAIGIAGAAGGLTVVSIVDEIPRTDRYLPGYEGGLHEYPLTVLGVSLDFVSRAAAGDWGGDRGAVWAWSLYSDWVPWGRIGQGTLAAGLALTALWPRSHGSARRREAVVWVGAGIALAALDAGALLNLRYPFKWLVISAFGLARLAGLGFEEVFVAPERSQKTTVALRAFAALGVTLGAVAFGVLVFDEQVEGAMRRACPPGLFMDADVAAFGLVFLLGRGALAVGCAYAVLRARSRGRISQRGAACLAGVLVLTELIASSKTEIPTTAVSLVDRAPPLVSLVNRCKGGPKGAPARLETATAFLDAFVLGDERLLGSERRALDSVARLRPNLGHMWGIRMVDSFDTVQGGAFARLTRDPRFAALSPPQRGALLDAQLFLVNRADMPKFAAYREQLQVLAEQKEGAQCLLVRNRLTPDYAYFVHQAGTVKDMDAGLDALLDRWTLPSRRVVLGPEGLEETPGVLGPAAPGRVVVTHFEPERVELEVEGRAAAWLVVREAFSPDWRCDVDGVSVPVARADLLYRAVFLPPGRHVVRFVYDPWWWSVGVRLTVVGWLLLLGALTASLRGFAVRRS